MVSGEKFVMCGCCEAGWETVKFLLEQGIRFSYFVTLDKEKAEQLNISGYKSFDDLAEKYEIPVYYVKKYSMQCEEDIHFFQANKFDLLVQGVWQRLFPKEVLDTLRVGAIGVHGSSEFLPKGRGRSPINWSLIEGKKRFIVHHFLLTPGIDDGDIFHYESFDINEWDTCRTLYYKSSIVTRRVLLEWIPKLLKGDFQLKPQIGEPTYYEKRTPEDGLIDWSNPLFQIYDFIRALTHPYPGAFTSLRGQRVFIWDAQPFDTRITYYGAREGEVVEIFSTGDFVVNCYSGLLLVKECDSPLAIRVGDIFGQ